MFGEVKEPVRVPGHVNVGVGHFEFRHQGRVDILVDGDDDRGRGDGSDDDDGREIYAERLLGKRAVAWR